MRLYCKLEKLFLGWNHFEFTYDTETLIFQTYQTKQLTGLEVTNLYTQNILLKRLVKITKIKLDGKNILLTFRCNCMHSYPVRLSGVCVLDTCTYIQMRLHAQLSS